jgi:hypothetical protein
MESDTSDSSDSSSSSSADTPTMEDEQLPSAGTQEPGPPRVGEKRKPSKAKRYKRKRSRMAASIKYLTAQVSGISNFIAGSAAFQPNPLLPFQATFHSTPGVEELDHSDSVSANVSGELFADAAGTAPPPPLAEQPAPGCSFQLPLNTVLKEPAIPKSLPGLVDFINSVQRFDSQDWDNVRYAEVQKQYCSSPGFTYLETNDEIKPFDKFNSLALIERGFATMTQALIKQNKAAQCGFKKLVEWSNSVTVVTPKLLEDKLNEIFVQGSFQKISNDVLQIACGHRAELIQQRRDNILRSIKDNFLKASLKKIPPTCDSLFNKELFANAIEKAGGPSKIFWPPRAPSNNKAAAQAQPPQQAQAMPSYANTYPNKAPALFNANYAYPGAMNRMPLPTPFMNYNPQARDYPRFADKTGQQTKPSRQRPNKNFHGTDTFANSYRGGRFSGPSTFRGQARRKF